MPKRYWVEMSECRGSYQSHQFRVTGLGGSELPSEAASFGTVSLELYVCSYVALCSLYRAHGVCLHDCSVERVVPLEDPQLWCVLFAKNHAWHKHVASPNDGIRA